MNEEVREHPGMADIQRALLRSECRREKGQ